MKRFVRVRQVSRAEEIDGDLEPRNARMRETAQSAVDGFYTKLDALNAAGDAQLRSAG